METSSSRARELAIQILEDSRGAPRYPQQRAQEMERLLDQCADVSDELRAILLVLILDHRF